MPIRQFHLKSILRRFSNSMAESGLVYIEVKDNSPLNLFKEWLEESKTYGKLKITYLNLATSFKNGDISNRTVVLQDFKEDSFIFVTDSHGRKTEQIKDNPKVAACFLWSYNKDGKSINRQVRVEGNALELPREECIKYYNAQALYGKIRAHICHQGQTVEWNDLKRKHDELLHDVKTKNKELPMPDYYAAYKIIPGMFDFYFSWDTNIADRVQFKKETDNWKFYHVAA